MKLMSAAGMLHQENEEDGIETSRDQIFFCSRTHSQLTQFANEARRVKVPPAEASLASLADQNSKDGNEFEEIRLLPLGSRKNLCINPKVAKLGNATAINERCLELQQPKTSKEHKCKFLPNKDNEPLVSQFRDLAMSKIRDIEDLASVGEQSGICPYYASRAAISEAEVVTLPYPLLIQKSAREALGIDLTNRIIVIDEAHNLIDSITSLNSVAVSLHQLQQSREQLTTYIRKFRNKLKGANLKHLMETIRLVHALVEYLQGHSTSSRQVGGQINTKELLASKSLDQIKLPDLVNYIHQSKLARKVAGYAAFEKETSDNIPSAAANASETPALMAVESLFLLLANPSPEGLTHWDYKDGTYWLKYSLLDPLNAFREVVESARCVVLAGGTMSPMDEYDKRLFPHLKTQDIHHFSCSHVIPKENLLFRVVGEYNAIPFRILFERRSSPTLLRALGQAICDMAKAVPDGMVVFFSSYQYLDEVIKFWKAVSSGSGKTFYDSLKCVKPIFQEQKSVNVETLLREYSESVNAGHGGLMLSVIGGKLSEGINFSDRLGRGVAVVGMPVPNVQSPDWKFKMDHASDQVKRRGGSNADAVAAKRELVMNVTMRAVNQSIGRAIRHRGDYAYIALLDERYNEPEWNSRLPKWIKDGLRIDGLKSRKVEEFFNTLHGNDMS